MATRYARTRRHHPYDTHFRAIHAPPHVPASDRRTAWLFVALAGAVMAAAAWAGFSQLFG